MKNAICILDKNGYVTFKQCCIHHSVTVTFNLINFPKESIHAIHIHEYGDTTDGCKSLGLHYNPKNTTHGSFMISENPRHAGDLINNFKSDKSGSFQFQYEDESITLFGEDSILGRSVVIHEGRDDLGLGKGDKRKESLISGNAGKRIVCGVIGLKAN
jgi:Cu-Zn family superoxide dismutase